MPDLLQDPVGERGCILERWGAVKPIMCATCYFMDAMVKGKRVVKTCKLHGKIPAGHEYVDWCEAWRERP